MKPRFFPFTAIVGQTDMQLALLLNVIDPQIGGVLLTGQQGSGKTTAVRSLVDILPKISVKKGCPFQCLPHSSINYCSYCQNHPNTPNIEKSIPFVNLPLGISEDRLVGSLNVEKLLQTGTKELQPGLLAEANRGILYIDEINLLQDHIVDLLLDVAASGKNVVEREGLSVSHSSNFILIGTMNPEEGELRPQIADRLGIEVLVHNIIDPELRAKVSRRVLEFERNPKEFIQKYKTKQQAIQQKIKQARSLLPEVQIPVPYYQVISQFAIIFGKNSLRTELILLRTARALAAYNLHQHIHKDDLYKATLLCFQDKLKRAIPNFSSDDLISLMDNFFENPPKNQYFEDLEKLQSGKDQSLDSFTSSDIIDPKAAKPYEEDAQSIPEIDSSREISHDKYSNYDLDHIPVTGYKSGKKDLIKEKHIFDLDKLQHYSPSSPLRINVQSLLEQIKHRRKLVRYSGKGSRVKILSRSNGHFVYSQKPREYPHTIDFLASIKHHYLHYPKSLHRVKDIVYTRLKNFNDNLTVHLAYEDVHEKIYEQKAPLSLHFIVDASASMRRTLEQTIKVIQSVHAEGYKKKDKVSVISFQGRRAEILQRPSVSFSVGLEKLRQLKATSYTPLASALNKTITMINQEQIKGISIPVIIIISDLGANISLQNPEKNASNNEDFNQIAEELTRIARKIGRKHFAVIIMKPRKSFATKYLGVDPFSVQKIEKSFRRFCQAKIFEFDAYNPAATIVKLKQILD